MGSEVAWEQPEARLKMFDILVDNGKYKKSEVR